MARAEGDVVITIGGNVSPLTDAVTKAERTLGKLNGATQRADKAFRAMVGTSTALQARLDAVTGVTERTGKSAEKAALAFEKFDKSKQAIDRLRASYDPLFAASKRYEAAVEELDDALRLGVVTQSQYAQMTQKLAASMLTMDGQQRAVGKSSNMLTMQVQNASYQVGDFFVQIASGTDATRALAQQMPQLLGGFGMWGAIAGAAVAIGGALIPMFFGASAGAEDLEKQTQKLSSAVSDYAAAVKAAKAPFDELIEKYGTAAIGVRELLAALQTGAEFTAISEANAQIGTLYSSLMELREYATGNFLEAPVAMMVFKDAAVQAGDATGRLREAMNDLGNAKGLRNQYGAALEVLAAFDAIRAATGELSAEQMEVYSQIAQIADELAKVIGITDDATGATNSWASAMAGVKSEIYGIASALASIGGGMIANASKFVELNARKAGKSKAEAVRAAKEFEIGLQADAETIGGGFFDKVLSGFKKQVELKGLDIDDELAAIDAAEREENKKGGGGGKDREGEKAARDLERLQQDFMSEQELLAVQYEERLIGLQEARANELLTEQEYNALKLQAQADFNDKMRDLDRSLLQEKLASWSGMFGDLSSLMNTNNKKMFKIGKAAAIAQAVVDGWSAATTAWDKGMKTAGMPGAIAWTAASLAKTGAMISSLKSTQFEGGGGGGSAGAAAAPAAAAPQAPLEVRLRGDGSAVGWNDLGTLLTMLNKEAGDRGYRLLTS